MRLPPVPGDKGPKISFIGATKQQSLEPKSPKVKEPVADPAAPVAAAVKGLAQAIGMHERLPKRYRQILPKAPV